MYPNSEIEKYLSQTKDTIFLQNYNQTQGKREENLYDRIILDLTKTEECSHIQDILHPKVYTKRIGNTSTNPVYKIFMKDFKIEEVPYPKNKIH